MKTILVLIAGLALEGSARAELPPLVGDGVHDDTAAIQARLDSGASLVYLPPPEKEYLISTTLVIRSGTELRLDRFTRVRLARDTTSCATTRPPAGGTSRTSRRTCDRGTSRPPRASDMLHRLG